MINQTIILLSTIFYKTFYLFRHIKIGWGTRITYSKFGLYNSVGNNNIISHTTMGDFSYTADYTSIARTTIGKFCSIGPGVRISLGQHPTSQFVSTHPAFYSKQKPVATTFSSDNYFTEESKVIVENDVWIGANAIIMDGTRIANGAIVAAGAVVTHDVPAYSIVAGVPARVIKYRFNQKQREFINQTEWWNKDIKFLSKNFRNFHQFTRFQKLFKRK